MSKSNAKLEKYGQWLQTFDDIIYTMYLSLAPFYHFAFMMLMKYCADEAKGNLGNIFENSNVLYNQFTFSTYEDHFLYQCKLYIGNNCTNVFHSYGKPKWTKMGYLVILLIHLVILLNTFELLILLIHSLILPIHLVILLIHLLILLIHLLILLIALLILEKEIWFSDMTKSN